ASLVLLVQPGINRLAGGMLDERSPALLAGVFAVGVYAGYFGAAAGVVLLALLTVSVAEPLARLVAARNVALGLANAVAAIGFALFGPVRWAAAAPLAAGFLLGGGLGPGLVRRLPGGRLRVAIAVLGLCVAVKLGFDTFGGAGTAG
ncbi:MAG TPA: sulfite exporter TauE/SafE family protein, partial [Actinomycetota bacterium]|nr:sulfite exporter TauE/SafE family protein [Actinomycetota bacterium]